MNLTRLELKILSHYIKAQMPQVRFPFEVIGHVYNPKTDTDIIKIDDAKGTIYYVQL